MEKADNLVPKCKIFGFTVQFLDSNPCMTATDFTENFEL